ncbi:hypothetical protein D3C71_1246810 [compost metagenome]
MAHLRLAQLLLLWRQRGRTGERGLTDGHPGQILGKRTEGGRQCLRIPLFALLQQVADGGVVQVSLLRLARPRPHRRQPQPGGVDAPGQRHIEQPQIFGKALAVGLRQGTLGAGQIENGAIARLIRLVIERGLGGSVAADKGQEHQRVLQPLGFVDGDDLHQFPLGFEPQYLLRILPVGAAHRLPQPTQQGVLPVQLAAHLLQQLAEMEEVGQPPLAIGARQQGGGEIAPVQQGPQHRQHAAAMPDLAVLHKLLHCALPRPLVAGQPIERLGIEIKQAGGERSPQAALFARVLAGVQNQQNLPRLHLLQHALAVRQIDGGDGEARQLLLHQLALGAGSHQHGDIPGLHRLVTNQRLALTGQGQQAVDLGGGGAGHLALVIPPVEGGLAGQLPAVEHGCGNATQQQRLALALRLHRQEGDIRLVDKGILGPLEQAVDRPHQRTAGAPVAPEGVVGAHISPRLNVGKDVGAAKAVDGLLGVTDHQ